MIIQVFDFFVMLTYLIAGMLFTFNGYSTYSLPGFGVFYYRHRSGKFFYLGFMVFAFKIYSQSDRWMYVERIIQP